MQGREGERERNTKSAFIEVDGPLTLMGVDVALGALSVVLV